MRAIISFVCSMVVASTLGIVIFFLWEGAVGCGDYELLQAQVLATLIGFPVGGVLGILIHRAILRQFRKVNILGLILSLVLAVLLQCLGTLLMDRFCGIIMGWSITGIFLELLLSCVGALFGYEIADRIAARLRRADKV